MADPISPLRSLTPAPAGMGGPGAPQQPGAFADLLNDYISQLMDAQAQSKALTQEFLAGGPVDVSQVAIAMNEAGLALQLLVEVRNKVIDAYETLLRMPV